jgi:hypothetical protein
MVVRNSTAYFFGGAKGDSASDEITVMSMRDGVYHKFSVHGRRPLGRMFHTAFFDPHSDQMLVVSYCKVSCSF